MNEAIPPAALAPDSAPKQLVEHFFRHESANLVAVLTRAFGVARIDLVEDTVQAAMIEAMQAWRHRGAPDNPAGWIHRVARNRILDALRREKIHQRALALSGQTEQASESLVDQWLQEEELPDSLLRMMFVCCHPSLDRRSQIALTLKVLCGFGVGEIARGLLTSKDAVKKRIQRAKTSLAEQKVAFDIPPSEELAARLTAVQDVLYLLFNEGYSTSHGVESIRDDICEDAARLCHLLCEHQQLSTPQSRALLALMLFHAARLESRVDADGNPVLLEDQDRTKWNRELIQIGEGWLARSRCDRPSQFHWEATIAMLHCRASCVAETDWTSIIRGYDHLAQMSESPIYVLNRAIARGQLGDIEQGLTELDSIRSHKDMRNYFLLQCAAARLHAAAGNAPAAIAEIESALLAEIAPHERSLLEKRLVELKAM